MAPGAHASRVPGFLLLQLLPPCLCAARIGETPGWLSGGGRGVQAGTHSLSYNFTINLRPTGDQPWCEVRGQVDQKPFFSYDCGTDQVKNMSVLGRLVNATQVWEEQKEALRDMGDVLKQQLADIKAEIYRTKDPLTLQGRMFCQREANGHTSGSWDFSFNGQMSLHFHSNNRRWMEVHSGFSLIKNKWRNDRDLTASLHRTSVGDCSRWLQKFLVYWEEMLDLTSNQEKEGEGKAPSVTAIEIAEPKSTAIRTSPWALLVILTCSVLVVLLIN